MRKDYAFFSSAHKTFIKKKHFFQDVKEVLKVKFENRQFIVSNHIGTKLEINEKKKIWKIYQYLEVKPYIQPNTSPLTPFINGVNDEVKGKLENILN